jgi:uncharacterized protein (TIGR02118 family)
MIKLTFCLRRRKDLSYEEFHDYWLNKHGPLVRTQMKALKIRKYVQVHQLNEPEFNAAIGKSRNAPEPYDGVAELWYDSVESISENGQTPEAREAGRILLEDERNFIDLENSPLWFNEEHVIIPEDEGASN